MKWTFMERLKLDTRFEMNSTFPIQKHRIFWLIMCQKTLN